MLDSCICTFVYSYICTVCVCMHEWYLDRISSPDLLATARLQLSSAREETAQVQEQAKVCDAHQHMYSIYVCVYVHTVQEIIKLT